LTSTDTASAARDQLADLLERAASASVDWAAERTTGAGDEFAVERDPVATDAQVPVLTEVGRRCHRIPACHAIGRGLLWRLVLGRFDINSE
jgi:hypothetical protein